MIALPICSADVIADSLTATVSGADNIPSYFRADGDSWKFLITASITGDSQITPEQIEIAGLAGTAKLSELGGTCSAAAGGITGFSCSYTTNFMSRNEFPLYNDFTIRLYSDAGSQKRSTNVELYGDIYPPKIIFNAQPIQSKGNVSFSYSIEERAYSESYNGKCAGIKKIEIKSDSNVLKTVNVGGNNAANQCRYSESVVLPISSLASNKITITAYDVFDHSDSKVSSSITIDNTAPIINAIRLVKNGVGITYLSPGTYIVNIEARIAENSLTASNVIADLSEIGGRTNAAADYCTKSGGEYTCIWNNREIRISSIGSKVIKVTAEDNYGNRAEQYASFSSIVDSSNPAITSFMTSFSKNGKNYIGTIPTNITLRIAEQGSGISEGNILIDLSNFGNNYGSSVSPDTCANISAGLWECAWQGITTDKLSGQLRLDIVSAKDNAGNPASGQFTYYIDVDKTLPVIRNITVSSLSSTENLGSIITSGSNLLINADVKELNDLTAYADFSSIKNDLALTNVPGECTKSDESSWKCAWRVDNIATGYLSTKISFVFYDVAMNHANASKEIEIYGVANQTPDFWAVSASDPMPHAIDRSTSEIISQVMFFPLTLKSSQNAQLRSIALLGCTGDTAYLESTASNINMFNNAGGSTEPYIFLKFKRFSGGKIDALDINCRIETKSLYNKFVYSPEYDNVILHIPLFNTELGEVSDSTKTKIKDLRETYVSGWWRFIGGLNTFMRYADGACRIFSTIRQVVAVFHSIETVWSLTQQTATSAGNIPGAAAANVKRILACETVEETKSSADKSWTGFFNKFCGFVNCKLGPMPAEEQGRKTPMLDKLTILGGRARLCGPIIDAAGGDFIKSWTGKTAFGDFGDDEYGRYANPSGYMNVKDSMVLSICSLCVPGIISNLQKYRQVQCMYIDCLERSIETGIPSDTCDSVKDYATCKYIVGEVFQFFPFTAFLQYYLDKVKRAVSDPFSIIGLGFGIGCRQYCAAPDDAVLAGMGHKICIGAKIIADIGDIADNIKTIFNKDTWSPQDDYCKNLAAEETEGNQTSSFLGIF